jgi:hypothetical protein
LIEKSELDTWPEHFANIFWHNPMFDLQELYLKYKRKLRFCWVVLTSDEFETRHSTMQYYLKESLHTIECLCNDQEVPDDELLDYLYETLESAELLLYRKRSTGELCETNRVNTKSIGSHTDVRRA